MAQFTLIWDNTNLIGNANITGQRASVQPRGATGWTTSGFNPANDLPISAVTTDSAVLTDNVVYIFKIEALCTAGGPILNDNGPQEVIGFACIVPTLTKTTTTATISINVTGLNIDGILLTLKKTVGNATLLNQYRVPRIGNTISHTQSGLASNTAFYWVVQLYATTNNIEVVSNTCPSYGFSTDIIATCAALTDLSVSAKVLP